MGKKLKLPVGIEDFVKLRTNEFYYVDKTGLLVDLLNNWSEVNLITRPRRFGKSLNIDMMKTFLEIGCDPSLFEGLEIMKHPDLCEDFMGKYPVISISLKSVEGHNYQEAKKSLCEIIAQEAERFSFLSDSNKLSKNDKIKYKNLVIVTIDGYSMSDVVLKGSLKTLTYLLHKHYGKQVILLIDEYDVPLDKANNHGYYSDMVLLIRNMFEQALKGNKNLFLAVLTGCLRVSKESIFTGLNNLDVYPITDVRFCECFGFTDNELKEMLAYYDLSEHYNTIKSWYDGYKFGDTDVYCPWDVLKHFKALRANPNAELEAYWKNTSGNDLIHQFVALDDNTTKSEIERLINGGTVDKKVNQELTYKELNQSIDNLWSVLFMTGYLTSHEKGNGDTLRLSIPNLGIREIFVDQIYEWFKSYSRLDVGKLQTFCNAFSSGNAQLAQKLFDEYLRKTISIRDTNVPLAKKENFYHGILLGIFSFMKDWSVRSNLESGDGFSDILIEDSDHLIGIVVEVKYGENADMDNGCKEALAQIEKMKYAQVLIDEGMTKILKYGVACYKKQCRIVLA